MAILKIAIAALVVFTLISAAWFLMLQGQDLAVGLPIGLVLGGIFYFIKHSDEKP